MKKLLVTFIASVAWMTGYQSCSIGPEYFSQVSPDLFFDDQEKVYQRFARPFTHWADRMENVPLSSFTATSTLTGDELIIPNRNGDWYDDGFYVNHYLHRYTPATDGYWEYAWYGFSIGVAQAWSAMEDIDKYADFEALGFPSGTRESMINQLNVLVAYFYLEGLDHFGGVPVYTSNQEELQARATDRETSDFIEKLILEALPALPRKQPGDAEQGYITQGTAAALLARLYFNAEPYTGENRYAECEKICTDIKNGRYGYYQLASDFRDIFGFTNATCSELMWAIPSANGTRQVSGGRPEYSTHYNTWAYLDNPQFMSWNGICLVPSLDISGKNYRTEAGNLGGPFKLGSPYAKFEDTDMRKKNYVYLGNGRYEGMFLHGKLINPLTGEACTADGSREYPRGDTVAMVDQVAQLGPDIPDNPDTPENESRPRYPDGRKEGVLYAEENSGVRLMKFSPIPNEADNSLRYNPEIPVIRLTEIQYMLAECKYRQGDKAGAAELINEVRARYFTATGGDPNPVPSDFDEYRFLDEWLIEFIGEGRRRTDLIRWGKYTTEVWWDHPADGAGKEYLNRMPVPAGVINVNSKIKQNPGY
ncbi:MAG: RagB/SusD family nutrient uptake outer membrane protein [Tannerella sp.]|jgi:hypothetical protein|nr:RagB/SusD family nutrient uptake outer membrane protein [Tannerella sp.]